MPYLTDAQKEEVALRGPKTPGQLNYAITLLLIEYWRQRCHSGYTGLNDIIGALESSKQEFYRRIVVPYEEKKRAENGDVYENETH